MRLRFQFLKLSMFALLLMFCGCGSSGNLGTVEGVVTIDGNPIDQAAVMFYPTGGRASVGYTDENGHYVLGYTQNKAGAEVAQHKVVVSTELSAAYDSELGNAKEAAPGGLRKEMLPPKYCSRKETELTATVKSGKNVFNFDLKTE